MRNSRNLHAGNLTGTGTGRCTATRAAAKPGASIRQVLANQPFLDDVGNLHMLFLSCIIMWPLPLMPISGRLIQSTVPPATLIALAYSVSIFLNVAQRGVFVVIEESAAPSRRASIRGQRWAA